MKTISILVPEHAVPASIVDPRYMFTAINMFLQQRGQPDAFNIELVGAKSDVTLNDGIITIHTDRLLDEVTYTDIVIIPAIGGNLTTSIAANSDAVSWIQKQHQQGAQIASLCTGAFLLASTGLLNGKKCSTHWLFTNQFRQMYPEVSVEDGLIITDQNGLYSSGGASSYWNLLLYLVEKYTTRELAIQAAKFFAIDISRDSQSTFMVFNGQRLHEDDAVKKAQDYIERNYNERISVEQLAEMTLVGRRSFERRFKKATCNTITEYIQRVKMEAAKTSLEKNSKTISEIMYDVGYTDVKSFREVFKKVTGVSPLEYKNRYRQHAL